mgnify:CR=1 FL=1
MYSLCPKNWDIFGEAALFMHSKIVGCTFQNLLVLPVFEYQNQPTKDKKSQALWKCVCVMLGHMQLFIVNGWKLVIISEGYKRKVSLRVVWLLQRDLFWDSKKVETWH